jgi:hypothetical protein
VTVTQDQRSTWLQKLDAECPYQIVLPRRQLMDDSAIKDFLLSYVGKFDLCASRLEARPEDRRVHGVCKAVAHVGGTLIFDSKLQKILAFLPPTTRYGGCQTR